MGTEHAPWVVYHVFSMSFHLFFVFRKGGQRHMGVPCTGVRPCMAVPPQETTHLKSFPPSKWISMHRLCAPRVAYLMGSIIQHLSIEFQYGGQPCMKGSMQSCPAMHSNPPWETINWMSVPPLKRMCVGRNVPLGLLTVCLAYITTCLLRFNRADSCTWGLHVYMSAHA